MPALDCGQVNLRRRMAKRLEAEGYFERNGRTFRKTAARLHFNENVKPALIRSVLSVAGLYKRGIRNAISPVVNHVEFRLKRLPRAFDGFTILQISDLHIDKVDGLAEALSAIIGPLRPDLCVLTGDYRYEIRGSCAEVYPRMQKILSAIQAGHGTVGILGNHDAAEIAVWLQEHGVCMLMNGHVALERGSDRIWIAGVDDPHDYFCDDLDAALDNVPDGGFKILLAHTPALYRAAAEREVDLYLCGHTHGGQIRLPFIGAIKKNGSYPRAYVQGKWVYNAMHAYTSWGAGCSTLPVRFNCPPEAALLTLRMAE